MRNLVRLERKNFPLRLLRLPKQSQYLYISGNHTLIDKPSLAIIGSRHGSEWGLDQAFKIGKMVSKENITVVSGLARGVDASAHLGALEGLGSTIAVLGSGFNRIYPHENLHLANRIEEDGLLISEYAPDQGPQRHHFLNRNRLIAALSDLVLVIDAATESGTTNAASFAHKSGIPTFALSNTSAGNGNKQLIQKGIARPLADPAQLLELVPLAQYRQQQMTFGFTSQIKGVHSG